MDERGNGETVGKSDCPMGNVNSFVIVYFESPQKVKALIDLDLQPFFPQGADLIKHFTYVAEILLLKSINND